MTDNLLGYKRMKVMRIQKFFLWGILFTAFSGFSMAFAEPAEDKFSKVEIKTVKLGHGIYMLTGAGGNIGISSGKDGVFMIDDQFAPLTPKIKQAIAAISDKPVRFMINTHWHYDHTGGNENLGKDGVVIVAHDNVYKRMSKDGFIKAFNKKIPASPEIALPVITFNDEVTFHLNDLEINVVHRKKSHTDGDSMVFFKSANVIHTGDIFFNGMYPFIDASSEGSIQGMIDSANFALSMSDDKTLIIPGHGPLGDKKSLTAYRDMLVVVRDRMQKLMDEGKSMEQIIALKPNSDLDEKWGNGFLKPDVFLKILNSAMP